MENSHHERHFSVDEANTLLAILKPLVAEILELRQMILEKQPQVWPVVQKAAGNGGSKAATQVQREFNELDQRVRRILGMGVLIKDINSGLLDFPAWRDGHEVYLCWRHGEERVAHWHEIEGGFSGRQPL